jgi:hypothetical protein
MPHRFVASGNLTVGQKLPELSGKSLEHGTTRIRFDIPRPTLFYVFAPECSFCKKNLSNIELLATRIRTTHRIIGVSLTSTNLAAYLKGNSLPFDDVLYDVADASKAAYKLGATPHTIVVSKDGVLQKDWVGAYFGDVSNVVGAFFHVQFSENITHLPVSN